MMILLPFINQRPVKAVCGGLILFGISFAILAQPDADSEQAVTIQADNANFDHEKGVASYIGKVIVDQGSRHLESDKLIIKRGKDNKINIMIATGKPARFHSHPDPTKPIGTGKAKTIKYYPQTDTVDLLGDAELTKDGDTISGPVLNYNFATGNLKSKSSKNKRTTFVLQPKRE